MYTLKGLVSAKQKIAQMLDTGAGIRFSDFIHTYCNTGCTQKGAEKVQNKAEAIQHRN